MSRPWHILDTKEVKSRNISHVSWIKTHRRSPCSRSVFAAARLQLIALQDQVIVLHRQHSHRIRLSSTDQLRSSACQTSDRSQLTSQGLWDLLAVAICEAIDAMGCGVGVP